MNDEQKAGEQEALTYGKALEVVRMACEAERALGNGGCGCCTLCCKENRERAELAEARLAKTEKERDLHKEKSERNYEPIKAWIAKYPDRAITRMWEAMCRAEEKQEAAEARADKIADSADDTWKKMNEWKGRAERAEARLIQPIDPEELLP